MSILGPRMASQMDEDFGWTQQSIPPSMRRYASVGMSQSAVAAKRRLSMRKMRAAKGKRTFKAAVKRAVGSVAETKCLQTSGSLTIRALGSTTTDAQFNAACICVTPQGAVLPSFPQAYQVLGNGIGQDQRIGDRVSIKGTYIDFLITAKPYDATYNPTPQAQIVQVFIVRPKTSSPNLGLQSFYILGGTSNSKLFENQSNADSGLNGTSFDLLRKVDTDNFQVLARRTYKIGYQGTLNTGSVVTTVQNNDFQQYVKDRVKLRPEDWRVNRAEILEKQPVYMFVSSVNADGSTANVNYIPVKFDFNLSVYYTDL